MSDRILVLSPMRAAGGTNAGEAGLRVGDTIDGAIRVRTRSVDFGIDIARSKLSLHPVASQVWFDQRISELQASLHRAARRPAL